MEIDNGKNLYSVLKVELIATVVFASTFGISFLGVYDNKYIPLHGYQYAILIILIFFGLGYFWYGLKHTYFLFNSDGPNITIKYFRILPKFIKPKPKMIKIPKTTYVKYKIETSFFGKRKALYLFQRTKKGVVKYPPIYVTSLNEAQMSQLKQALRY